MRRSVDLKIRMVPLAAAVEVINSHIFRAAAADAQLARFLLEL